MSFKIGCPMLKLALAKAGNAGKHTGRMQAVLCEGWECGKDDAGKPYRHCNDVDYNPALTASNVYIGERNAFALGRQIERVADDYSARRRAAGGRGLRKTAAIAVNGILKPPADVVNGLTPAQQEQLRIDLWDSFTAVAKDYVKVDALSAVWQVDEAGGHWHYAGPALTPDGKLDADAIVNAKFFRALNQKLPAEMRQRGWDVSDCVNYDADKAKSMTLDALAQYKAECKAKRPKSGLSSAAYKARQAQARAEAAEAEVARLREELATARRTQPEAARAVRRANRDMRDLDSAYRGLDGVSGDSGMSL